MFYDNNFKGVSDNLPKIFKKSPSAKSNSSLTRFHLSSGEKQAH